jgi:hypothetical protein
LRTEDRSPNQFFRATPALRWVTVFHPVVELLIFDKGGIHIGQNIAWANGVALYIELRPLCSHGAGEHFDPTFAAV